MCSFPHFTLCFARDLCKRARVPATHPVFRARFGQKCAHSGPSLRVLRAIWTKVRAFRPLTSCFAHILGENVLIPALHPVFRAHSRQKCARRSSYCGVPYPKMTVCGVQRAFFTGPGHQNGGFWGTTGSFCRSGTPKWLVLGHVRRVLRVRWSEGGGKQGRGTAAGVNAIRRLQRGRCGGLC